jgi:LDH2 family malate/lactate/ureidoglycolate dehydrogenase
MALDIARFSNAAVFRRSLQGMVDQLRALPTLPGVDSVKVAGDPEKATERTRTRKGIPIEEALWRDFLSLSPDFDQVVKR